MANAGYRSLGAFWLGGTSSVSQGGYRSLLAFWLGGASGFTVTPTPAPESAGGQWYDIRYEQAWVKDHNDEWLPRIVPMEDWLEFYILAEDDF